MISLFFKKNPYTFITEDLAPLKFLPQPYCAPTFKKKGACADVLLVSSKHLGQG